MLKTLLRTEGPQCLNGPTSKATTSDDICVGLHSLVMSTPLGRVNPFLCKSRAHLTMMLSCLAHTNWAFISWITGFQGALRVAKWFGGGWNCCVKGAKHKGRTGKSIGEKWQLGLFKETKHCGAETPARKDRVFPTQPGSCCERQNRKWPAQHPTGAISRTVNFPAHPSYGSAWRFPRGRLPSTATPLSFPPHFDCSWPNTKDKTSEGQKMAEWIYITNRSLGLGVVHSFVCLFKNSIECIPDWFQPWDPPASALLVMESQMCATMLSPRYSFKSY